NCKGEDIIVASTGVIGVPMEIQPFETGIPQLVEKIHDKGANEAAVGIMTTDTKEKEIAVEFMVGNTLCKLGGMAKGSGMIHPNMATMLSFITGDTKISGEMLQQALSEVVEDTFNQVSVDGDTSTNDTVAILCNGLAGNEEIAQEGEAYDQFKAALLWVMTVLSKEIAADGEGAGKLMEVEVFGAPDVKVARLVAKSIISSSLFKAALFGEDANWGRILCAIGYTDAEFSADNISVEMESAGGKLLFCENSGAVGFSEEKAKKILKEDQVRFIIDLNDGDGHAFAWGCDLTYDYVKINGDYRS
ncbi:MAG: bifunctional glutamate N-acetyltransferase/amino-acid acetyltransferase ArgJ, partial [Anaerovoracaceae bacterium]